MFIGVASLPNKHLKKFIMKNFKLAAIVLLASVITILSSCSKSDPTPAVPPAATGSGTLTATIAGSAFTSIASNFSLQGNSATIQGADATGKSISIQITGLTTAPVAGTYKLYTNSSNFVGGATMVYGPNQTYSSIGCDANLPQTGFAPTGTITFTTLSTAKIEGTFQFNAASLQSCSDVKVVTSGIFSKTF